jgi:hypothetical protein
VSWSLPLTDTDPSWLWAFALVLFLGVTACLGLLSGWWSLLGEFRAEEPTPGVRLRFVSGEIGRRYLPVRYGSTLLLTLSSRGFRLGVLFPFGILSPALFIPWSAVESLEWVSGTLAGRQVRLRLRGHWPMIMVRGRAAERLRDQYAAWQAAGAGPTGGRTAPSWPYP